MNKSDNISPGKRYVLRVLELAETDPEIKQLMPDSTVGERARTPELSVDRAIDTLLEGYAERPALGERKYQIELDEETGSSVRNYLPEYHMVSYRELQSRIHALANTWRHHDKYGVAPDEFVCIIGFASVDYAVIDTACAYAQAVTVPMQSATSGADIDEIFANINPAAVAATIEDLVIAAQHACTHGGIRTLIAFDYDQRDDHDRAQWQAAQSELDNAGVNTQLVSLNELLAFGRDFTFEFLPAHPEAEEHMGAIIHSSGSTGKPKGAIFKDAANQQGWLSRSKETFPTVSVLFAPLNHGMGRALLHSILGKGGSVYITLKSDMSTLFEDIRLARPTYMSFFPRVFELIYQYYQNEVTRRVSEGAGDEQSIGQQVMQQMRHTFLGDRLRAGTVGSAPTSQTVKDFIVDCFDILLAEGYSNTEAGAGAVTINGRIQRPPVIEYKLADVPELGYYTTDKPYPRGELCYKTEFAIRGYYKQPEATAQLFDEEGFTRTGDIVEERGTDHVVIIDRRKDVLKLSQGEYVAVGPLGTVFESGSPLIKQTYIYGNSMQSYLLAVIVPDVEAATTMLGEGYTEDQLRSAIRDQLQSIAQDQQLKSFEVPRDFIIEHQPFSQENGLLSSVKKRLRPALQRKYGERLEALYEQQDRRQEEELKALKDPDSPLTTLEKLGKLLESNLRRQNIDLSQPKTFSELGGDSLGAVLFSMSIEDIFGVTIPADSILSPTGSPQQWAEQIEKTLLQGDDARPTFSSIHGKDATLIQQADLDLEKFLDEDTVANAPGAAKPVEETRTVLLTGANGFLGRAVCLQYLEKLAPVNGKLICLIRALDDAAARARLDEVFKGVDPQLEGHYKSLAENHLEVLAGDVGEPLLGLSEATFNRLASEVDRISHVGALVNHRLHYTHLFGPNVAGSAEIIRLALTTRIKAVDFVSTEAVLRHTDMQSGMGEDAALIDSVELSDHYGNGYSASKWAGEYLMQQANSKFGVPVNTLRGDMMLAHSTIKGMINVSDLFTRLLFSIVTTGIAPYSFYKLNADGSKIKAHYDAAPVDVVAASVVGVSDIQHSEYRTYNIHNYHEDDGCSLDTFVDWIESAGYSVTRIQEYDQWLARFRDKLNTLPEEQKQQSAIEVLGAYAQARDREHKIPCDRFRQLVAGLSIGPEIPSLDEAYIHKFLGDMQALGLIQAP